MGLTIIDKKFIEEIKLTIGTYHSIEFTENEKSTNADIVPEKQTIHYLLNNYNIDEVILDYYYSGVNRFFTDKEYESISYTGRKERALNPYGISINKAYHSRMSLVFKLEQIIHLECYLNGKRIKYFEDLMPYFKVYANGFKNGYDSFEEINIKPYLPMFADKQDYVNKVFEYLTFDSFGERSWYNNHNGFTYGIDENKRNRKMVNEFQDGELQGFFYRAWSIVFSNNLLFEPLFKQYYEKRYTTQETAKESQNPYSEIFKGDDNINFLIFKNYSERYIIDFYADYSFLFQKMKSITENRLHNVKHLDFMIWLKNHNYISEKVYDSFISKGTFSTKYNSAQRENNYYNVINDLLK